MCSDIDVLGQGTAGKAPDKSHKYPYIVIFSFNIICIWDLFVAKKQKTNTKSIVKQVKNRLPAVTHCK